MKNRWPLFFGTCLESGFVGRAPGTIGSVLGTLCYPYTFAKLSLFPFIVTYLLSVVVSIWICDRCSKILQKSDPSEVNLDEFIAMPLCFWFMEHCAPMRLSYPILLWIGFLIFRFFDIVKPLGIRKVEKLPGGYGIVGDDLAAALLTTFCLFALNYLVIGFNVLAR